MRFVPPDLFRRNLIGLLVVLASFGILYVTEFGSSWSGYRHTIEPEHAAAAGGSVGAGGLTWQIESVRQLDVLPGPIAQPLPDGTVARVVTIRRQGTGPDVPCSGALTDGTRRWKAEGIGLRSVLPPPQTTVNCSAPGPVQFTFLLPRDITPTAVDVLSYDDRIMVRLEL
jgi:hypothetical protein